MRRLVAGRTSMTNGNANDAPASTSVPRRPRKKPSNVIMPTKARKLRTLGVDNRSNVGRIGPSSISLVRAAPPGLVGAGAAGTIIGEGDGREFVALRSFIRRSSPCGAGAALETNRLQEPGGCVESPTASNEARGNIYTLQ